MSADTTADPTSSVRVLHLSHDSIFLARFAELMEHAAPGASDFVIYAPGGVARHRPAHGSVEVVASPAEASGMARRVVENYDLLVVHYMREAWADVLPHVPSHVRTVWSGFGGDYYGDRRSPDTGLLEPLTARVREEQAPSLNIVGRAHRGWRQVKDERRMRAAAAAVDYFSAPLPTDLDVFSARFRRFSGQFAQLNYATAQDSAPEHTAPTGQNVLIGNSASYTNNHLDVFDAMSGVDLGGRRVIVPLSYGLGDPYRSRVIEAGRQAFGSDFFPLLELMPLAEYTEVVASCAHVVMGHRRQQGVGNIMTALLGGADLVVHRDSPVHAFLEAEGAHVRTIEQLGTEGFDPGILGDSERQTNRDVVHRFWGQDRVVGNIRTLLQSVVDRRVS